jgi:hypothetical protein
MRQARILPILTTVVTVAEAQSDYTQYVNVL